MSIESAFVKMVEDYQKELFRYALSRILNAHDAEEIMQETFVQAWIPAKKP